MKAILTFHSIDATDSVLSFAPGSFARLVESLARSPLPILDLDSLLDPGTVRGVALTFDDGMRSVYTHALPVLADHGAPAHLFLTTGVVGGDNRWPGLPRGTPRFEMLDWGQVEACHAAGVRIESHTVNHPDLRTLDPEQAAAEFAGADEVIERRLGRRPRYLAYPYGFSNARVRRQAAARYRGCATTYMRTLRGTEDPGALPRLDTYYLRSRRWHERLAAPSTRLYIGARSVLRSVRGTQ